MATLVFKLEIECENAAFEDNGRASEIAHILRAVAVRVEHGEATERPLNLRDSNGNVVGTFRLKMED